MSVFCTCIRGNGIDLFVTWLQQGESSGWITTYEKHTMWQFEKFRNTPATFKNLFGSCILINPNVQNSVKHNKQPSKQPTQSNYWFLFIKSAWLQLVPTHYYNQNDMKDRTEMEIGLFWQFEEPETSHKLDNLIINYPIS